ncbi:DMT family transporter [Caviibacter abscessus]|uniref:DMT family transporter n=1 Tax=Caviibacter abscessus TaxID=1766719 RepID=UPI00082EAF67|nr:DMT family transporter [Caviibacter abscessus]
MKKENNFGWLLIIISATMWGIDGILLTPKYFVYGFYDVKFIVFMSHLVPSIILSLLFFNEYKVITQFKKQDYVYYGLISLFGGTIGTLAIVKALQLSNFSLSLVTVIQKMQPIFAVILAYFLLKEKPKKRFYIILIVSLISLYFLIFGFKNPKLLPENNLKAAFYSLIAAMSFGSSTVFGKKIVTKHSFLTTTFYRFIFTTVITGIILVFSNSTISSAKLYVSNCNLYILTIIIAVYSLSSILIYYKGMTTTKATYATICELAYPITSVFVEAITYKRLLSPIQLIAATILVLSIFYLNLGKNNN